MSETIEDDELTIETEARRRPAPPPAGGAVYGLGLLGALVWFWRQADGFGGHIVAVLKAIVWPAFLVHDAFEALRRVSLPPERDSTS